MSLRVASIPVGLLGVCCARPGQRFWQESTRFAMSASPFGTPEGPAPRPTEVDPAGSASREMNLLETALERAEKVLSGDDPLELADVEAVRAVGRRRPGEAFSLEPVAIELVEAVLRAQFPGIEDRNDLGREIARYIARTLWEDDYSRVRLEALWSHISGAR
jgi:hypothetical protein